MRSQSIVGAIALAASLSGTLPATTAYGQGQAITIGYFPGALISLPALVAKEGQFFERNGLAAELVPISSGPGMTAAVSSGSVTFVNNSWDNLLVAVDKGLPVRGVAGSTVRVPFALIGRRGLTLPRAAQGYPAVIGDLVGKNWGVLALGVSIHFMSVNILTDAGYKPSDATFLAIGLPNTARPALQRGTADVYLSIEPLPSIVAAKNEGSVIIDLAANQGPAIFRDLGYNGWWASTTTVRDKPDVVARFARSLEEAYCWYSDPANLDQVVALMQRYAAVPDLTPEEYRAMVSRLIPTFGLAISTKTIDTWSSLLLQNRQLSAPRSRADVLASTARESFTCSR